MNIDKFNERLSLRGASILTANKPRRSHIDTILPKKINVVFEMPNLWNKSMKEQLEGLLKSEDFQLNGFLGVLGEYPTSLDCLYIPNSWLEDILETGNELKYELQSNLRFFGEYSLEEEGEENLKNNERFINKDVKLLNGLSNLAELNEKVEIKHMELKKESTCFMSRKDFIIFSNLTKALSVFIEMIELMKEMPEYSDSMIKRLSERYIERWTMVENEILMNDVMF